MKPTAVIVDIDGTLCDITSVRHHVMATPKNFDAFHSESIGCPANFEVLTYMATAYREGHQILLVTGRVEKWRTLTTRWIQEHVGPDNGWPLYMRPDGDYRPDTEIKRDIYNRISEWFDVVAAIDDNPSIVALWQELGIPTTVVPGWPDGVTA